MEDWYTTYCLGERKYTGCTEPSGYKTTINGRTRFWCTCISCGEEKSIFVKGMDKLMSPSKPKN